MGNILDKSQILNRIKKYYSLDGNSALARFLGVAPNTITNWYSRNSIDYDLIFSKCVNINFDWLLTGEGNISRGYDTEPKDSSIIYLTQRIEALVEENTLIKSENAQLRKNTNELSERKKNRPTTKHVSD